MSWLSEAFGGGGGGSPTAAPAWLWEKTDQQTGVFAKIVGYDDADQFTGTERTLLRELYAAVDPRNTALMDGEGRRRVLVQEASKRPDELLGVEFKDTLDTYLKDWLNATMAERYNAGVNDSQAYTTLAANYVQDDFGADDLSTLLKSRTGVTADNFKGAIGELIQQAANDAIVSVDGPIKQAKNVMGDVAGALLSDVKSELSSYKDISDTFIDDLVSKIGGKVDITSAQSLAQSAVSDITNFEHDMRDAVESALSSFDIEAQTKVSGLFAQFTSDVTGFADAALDNAINKAQEAINTSAIDDAVDAFEASALPEYMRSVNRFNGGLVDINAVHGSAFILGNASLENSYREKIEDFRARLTLDTYTRVLPLYVDVFQRSFTTVVSAYIQQVGDLMATFRSVYSEKVRAYLYAFGEHVRTYITLLGEYARSYKGVTGLTGNAGMSAFIASLESFRGVAQAHINSFVSEELDRRQLSANFVTDQAHSSIAITDALNSFRLAMVDRYDRLYHNQVTAYREQELDNVAIEEKGWSWPLTMYQRGASILAAVGGGVGTSSPGPSPLQTVLSTVATTAYVGAKLKEIFPGNKNSSSPPGAYGGGSGSYTWGGPDTMGANTKDLSNFDYGGHPPPNAGFKIFGKPL